MVVDNLAQGQGSIVPALNGRFDFKSRHAYQNAINQALPQSPNLVIFDFSHMSHIDSAGLGLLTLTYKQQTDHGINMVIAAPPKTRGGNLEHSPHRKNLSNLRLRGCGRSGPAPSISRKPAPSSLLTPSSVSSRRCLSKTIGRDIS